MSRFMNEEIKQFIEESTRLELNMSDLYQFFYAKFPEDSQFWWDLSMEEINHASLIRSINDLFFPEGMIPAKDIERKTEQMREANHVIRKKIEDLNRANLTRSEAFLYAFELENSSGEIHFELFMNVLPESKVDKIFQKLNGEDKNHAMKINEYMRNNFI